jgi:DNA mismatch repair protein MutL
MTEINILSPHVADLIAAGEVVERPASVIKELVENSFDAGAKNVTVEIRDGGATFIRVSDDGRGMSPDDAGVAFLRHATSKLRDESGLEAIGTMGFRGEALAAISAVSHIELLTRRRACAHGHPRNSVRRGHTGHGRFRLPRGHRDDSPRPLLQHARPA